MSWFLVVGGLLLVAILVALLLPLLRAQSGENATVDGRDDLNLNVLREHLADLEKDFQEGRMTQAVYEQARQELERRTLEDAGQKSGRVATVGRKPVFLALAMAVFLPVLAFSLYSYLGTPDAVIGKPAATAGGANGEHALSQEQISAMVEKLALRLQENPEDGQGWLMLGRSYAVLGRYPESAAAFSRAMALLPPDAQHYADFADIVAMGQGRKLSGEPEKLVRRALQLDPRNIKALALSGTIAFERQDYAQAIAEWRKVQALVPEDSPAAAGIRGSIRDAENRMAISGGGVERVASAEAPSAKVSGVVVLDPKIRSQVMPGDTLFVFARAVNGPKVPVAMMRRKAEDLPMQFVLDDSMSMTPQFKLSTTDKVVIGARISKSGDALPRAGDIEGLSQPVSVGASNIKVLIERTVQ